MPIEKEVKDLLTGALEHDDKIQKMDVFIRMENGNEIRYNLNRKKEDRLRAKDAIRKADLKYKEDMRLKRQEIKKARLDAKLNREKLQFPQN